MKQNYKLTNLQNAKDKPPLYKKRGAFSYSALKNSLNRYVLMSFVQSQKVKIDKNWQNAPLWTAEKIIFE